MGTTDTTTTTTTTTTVTEAARKITFLIEEYLDLYKKSDTLDDRRIKTAFAAVNKVLPIKLTAETLDGLFADFSAVADAETALSAHLVRRTEAPEQEAELGACANMYVGNLNLILRSYGYQGENWDEDDFIDQFTH